MREIKKNKESNRLLKLIERRILIKVKGFEVKTLISLIRLLQQSKFVKVLHILSKQEPETLRHLNDVLEEYVSKSNPRQILSIVIFYPKIGYPTIEISVIERNNILPSIKYF